MFFFLLWECRFRALPEFPVQDSVRGNVKSAQLSPWRRFSQAKPESNFPTSAQQRCVCVFLKQEEDLTRNRFIRNSKAGWNIWNISASVIHYWSPPFMISATWLDLAPNRFFQRTKLLFFFPSAATAQSVRVSVATRNKRNLKKREGNQMLMVDSFVFRTDLRELRLEHKSYVRGNAKHIQYMEIYVVSHAPRSGLENSVNQPSAQINRSHLCKQEDWQKGCKCIWSQ